MHDNKLRLSPDIIAKAEEIAETWGLKNSRAAVEAVFRKYADDYQYGRQPMMSMFQGLPIGEPTPNSFVPMAIAAGPGSAGSREDNGCAALSELDDLLGL
jgi:hypothetical protein